MTSRKEEMKFFPNFKACMVSMEATVKDGLIAISKSGALLAAVVDSSGLLLGVFTDSDARRAILAGAAISDPLSRHMTANPVVSKSNADPSELIELSASEGVREIPLINDEGYFSDLFVVVIHQKRISILGPNSVQSAPLPNAMFLIAGGKGTRLRSVISDRPKPLALVGGRPIIQTIIENASNAGICKFYVSVNYKAEYIVEHLKSDCYKGLDIECIHEQEFLGTAGSLGYLNERWQDPIVVSNADILSDISIARVLQAHRSTGAIATCVVRPYQVQVPFGVVELGEAGVIGISEKPIHKHIVNTGIYVLSSPVKRFLKVGVKLDMPDLLRMVIHSGDTVAPFLMHEYWRDVGRPEEYELANAEYFDIFGRRM